MTDNSNAFIQFLQNERVKEREAKASFWRSFFLVLVITVITGIWVAI